MSGDRSSVCPLETAYGRLKSAKTSSTYGIAWSRSGNATAISPGRTPPAIRSQISWAIGERRPALAYDDGIRAQPPAIVREDSRILREGQGIVKLVRGLPQGEDQILLARHRLKEAVDEDSPGPGARPDKLPGRPGKQGAAVDEVVVLQEPEVCIEEGSNLGALGALEITEGVRVVYLPHDNDGEERREFTDGPGAGEQRESRSVGSEDIGKDETGFCIRDQGLYRCGIKKDLPCESLQGGYHAGDDGNALLFEAVRDLPDQG